MAENLNLLYNRMLNDKEFQKLSWSMQQEVRSKVLLRKLQADPDFNKLDPGTQQDVFSKLHDRFVMKSVPAYEDPTFYTLSQRKFVQGVLAPALQNSLIAMGVTGIATGVDKLLGKITGKDRGPTPWQMMYSPDAVKMIEWIAERKYDNPNLPRTMATIGEVADWIGIAGLTSGLGGVFTGTGFMAGASSGAGIGTTKAITSFMTKAAAGQATKSALGRTIGNFVVNGLGRPGAKKLLTMGAREWVVNTLGTQAVRSIGAGAAGVTAGIAKGQLAPDVPWNSQTQLNFKSIATTFGQFAALDYLFNTVVHTIAPFTRLVAKSFGITKSVKMENLKALGELTPIQMEEYVRRIKLGSVDDATWKTLSQTTKDHLTARAFVEQVAERGPSEFFHDPVTTAKSTGFLLNFDVVDNPLATEVKTLPDWLQKHLKDRGLKTTDRIFTPQDLSQPSLTSRIASEVGLTQAQKDTLLKSGFLPSEGGFYRVRTSPGATLKQIINGEEHLIPPGEVIAESARLPEVNRIIADSWAESKSSLARTIEKEELAVMKLQDKIDLKVSEGGEEALVEVALDKQRLNSMIATLEGHKITYNALVSYDPIYGKIAQNTELHRAAFNTDALKTEPGRLASQRSAITYAEASVVQARTEAIIDPVAGTVTPPQFSTVRFRVDLPDFAGQSVMKRQLAELNQRILKLKGSVDPTQKDVLETLLQRRDKLMEAMKVSAPLSGKEASLQLVEGRPHQVRTVKDFFVRESSPFRLKPAEGDFNALAVWRNAADDYLWENAKLSVQGLNVNASVDELAQAKLVSLGYDAIRHQDGTITILLPRTQIKHVSDLIDVNKGTYRAGFDVGRPAGRAPEKGGLNPKFLSDLGKDLKIRQIFKIPVSDKVLLQNDAALANLARFIYGDVKEDVVRKVVDLYLQKIGKKPGQIAVKLLDGVTPDAVAISRVGNKTVLNFPRQIKTVKEQFEFLQALGESVQDLAGGSLYDLKVLEKYLGVIRESPVGADAIPGVRGFAKPTTPKEFVKQIGEAGEEYLKQTGQLKVQALSEKSIKRNMYSFPLEGASIKDKESWLQLMAGETKGTKFIGREARAGNVGDYVLEFPDGSRFHTNDVDILLDEFMVHNTSEAVLRNELADTIGWRLERTDVEGKFFRVLDGKVEKYSANTIPELLKLMNFRPSRIDSIFAPRFVEVGNHGVTFSYNGKYLIGSMNDARKVLDKFVDPASEATRKLVKKTEVGKISQYIDESWEVEIPGWGIRRRFLGADAPQQAKAFLDGRYKEYDEVQKLANARGFMLRYKDGTYRLIDETGTYLARNVDEVGKILARSPDPSFAPNLVPEVDEATQLAIGASFNSAFMPDYWALPSVDKLKVNPKLGLTNFTHNILPLHDSIVTYAKKTNQHKIAEMFNGMEAGRREAVKQANDTRRLILFNLSETGKKGNLSLFSEDKLRGMYYYLEQATDEGKREVAAAWKLEGKHTAAAERIRDLLGTDPIKNPGLFGKYGIDARKLIFEYMPRLREASARLAGPGSFKALFDGDIGEFLAREFGGKDHIPRELVFWAENGRLSDLVDFAREDNLLKVLNAYNEKGHLKLFLNEHWKQLDNYMKNAPVDPGQQAQDMILRYREQVMGSYKSNLDKAVAQFGRDTAIRLNTAGNKIRKILGKPEKILTPDAGSNLADLIFTNMTMTTQAYRIWLTARNVTQVYTTGGALLGNRWVLEGENFVLKDPQGAVDVMRERGSLTEALPLLTQPGGGEGKIAKGMKKVTEKGMVPMKTSDDLTRAVVYYGAEKKWDHYWAFKQKNPAFDFNVEAGVNMLHDEVAAQVNALLREGTPEAIKTAKHLYSHDSMMLTMFDYNRATSPRAFHGFLGKLFGQYQIYPSYYISLVNHFRTHGTAAQKLGAITRLGANAAAVGGALYAMGLDGQNSMPWVPAQISGGPLFNLAWTAMQATNTTSYKGRAALGELKGMVMQLLPGSYEFRMISNFIKYMEAGKPLLAFYALTSAPIRPDLRIR